MICMISLMIFAVFTRIWKWFFEWYFAIWRKSRFCDENSQTVEHFMLIFCVIGSSICIQKKISMIFWMIFAYNSPAWLLPKFCHEILKCLIISDNEIVLMQICCETLYIQWLHPNHHNLQSLTIKQQSNKTWI